MIKQTYQILSDWVRANRAHLYWCLGLGLLALCLLGKYLVTSGEVLSSRQTDTFAQLIYTYALSFDELAKGHLTLWNPYVYGGQPFLGQFQTGLLYPVCWLFMFLPTGLALNWLIFTHVWLMGVGVYGWAAYRGVRPLAAFAAGAAMMLSGPFFLHIYSGHIPHLCCMALAPLVFWGIDGWLRSRHLGWIFLSSLAAALQIYAGHPQYFYYTAIVAGIYSLVFLPDANRKLSAALGLLAIYPLAVLLSAAQLFPGLAATAESVRSGGADFGFASMFALPFENFLTLLAPWFFGDMTGVPYWGRCYLWEMQLYCGIGTLLLAGLALHYWRRRAQVQWLALLAVTVLLALGARTPLYQVLYELLPGYSLFRGTSKFAFFLILFVTLLAGHGLNALLAGKRPSRRLGWGCVGAGAVLALVAASLLGGFSGWFNGLLQSQLASGESYLPRGVFGGDAAILTAQAAGGKALLISAAWLLLFGGALLGSRRWPRAAWVFAALMVIDALVFAAPSIASFKLQDTTYPVIGEVLKKNPGEYRTLNLVNPESNVGLRSEGLWGYDPFVLKRYAEFMFFTQNLDPGQASQNLPFRQNSPLLALVRGRLAFTASEQGIIGQPLQEQIFPRFYVVTKYRVLRDRDTILRTLADSSFDARQEVILEEDPLLPPDPGEAKYQIRYLAAGTDQWPLEVAVAHSSILVMTDAYSRDWRATPLPGSTQTNYHVLPANYALRGIPLAPGRHVIRIHYVPSGYHAGLLVSGLALLALGLCCFNPVLRGKLSRFAAVDGPAKERE
jgi:hypothetical protein